MRKQSIYLAGPYQSRFMLTRDVAPVLKQLGYEVTSSWIYEPKENDESWNYLRARRTGSIPADHLQDALLCRIATRDDQDLVAADILLRFPNDGTSISGGGKYTEMGMAISLAMDVCIIGNKESIFDYLPYVRQYADVDDFLQRHLGVSPEQLDAAHQAVRDSQCDPAA